MSSSIRTRISLARRRLRLHIITVKETLSTDSHADSTPIADKPNGDLLDDTHLLLEIRTPFAKAYRSLLESHEEFEALRAASEAEEAEYTHFIDNHGDYTRDLTDASETLTKLDTLLDKFVSECHNRGLPLADDDALTATTAKSEVPRPLPRKKNTVTDAAASEPSVSTRKIVPHRSAEVRVDYLAGISNTSEALSPSSFPNPPTSAQSHTDSSASAFVTAALVGKTLPHFEGDILLWPEFSESFNSLVRHGHISGGDKLSLLRLCLSGEAAEVIAGLSQIDRNYSQAILLLEKEYDRPHLRHHAILTRLRNLPPCHDGHNLRTFYLRLNVLIRQLLPNGDLESPDLLVNLLTSKLPLGMQTRILRESSRVSKFGVYSLLSILYDAVETEKIEKDIMRSTTFDYCSSTPLTDPLTSSSTETSPPLSPRPLYREVQATCRLCRGSHSEDSCTTYTTPQDRSTAVVHHDLCRNCLHPNHRVEECRSRFRCRRCKSPHHTSTCTVPFPAPATSANQRSSDSRTDRPRTSPPAVPTTVTLHSHSAHSDEDFTGSPLPCLDVTVASPQHPEKTVAVTLVFDTACNASYIDEQLANDLHLPTLNETTRSTYVFDDPTPRERKVSIHPLCITLPDGHQEDVRLCSSQYMTPMINWTEKKNGIFIPRQSKPKILLGMDLLCRFFFTPTLHTEHFPDHTVVHTELGPFVTMDSIPPMPPDKSLFNLVMHGPPTHLHHSPTELPQAPSLHSRSIVSSHKQPLTDVLAPLLHIDRSLTWDDVFIFEDRKDKDEPPDFTSPVAHSLWPGD